ncbi:hypothetical protein MASR2M78_23530 [Treponema sp.]
MDNGESRFILLPMDRYDVAIVGGGGTGAAAAYDLALRGFSVALFEKGELTSGTTGRHHGQLHSGARYAMGDVHIAHECMTETRVLRRIAADCIEYNQGLFLATDEEGSAMTDAFVAACRAADISATEIPVARALAMEKAINPHILRSVLVPDGTIDAYRLAMSFFASAKKFGAAIFNFTEVLGIETKAASCTSLRVRDLRSGKEISIAVDAIVNAAGPWADKVAALAGADLALTPAAGAMLAVRGRLCNMVISHLRPPTDGDIIVPQRKLSIIGSTQRRVESPDGLLALKEEVALLLSEADKLIPGFSRQSFHAAWAAARPLAGSSDDDGRNISRDIAVIDHAKGGGPRGLFSITGGKATTLRVMGELGADAVTQYLGERKPCRTAEFPLLNYTEYWRVP